MREFCETSRISDVGVQVQPKFMKDKAGETDGSKNIEKFNFECRLTLVPTQPWISAPEHLLLNHGGACVIFKLNFDETLLTNLALPGRSFNVKIDPTKVNPGEYVQGDIFVSKGKLESINVVILIMETSVGLRSCLCRTRSDFQNSGTHLPTGGNAFKRICQFFRFGIQSRLHQA